QYRNSGDDHLAVIVMRRDSLLYMFFEAVHLQGRQKLLIGQLGQTGILAADPDKLLYMVVPWSNVTVPYRPVYGDPLLGVCLKVQIAQPETMPRPHKRFAAGLISLHPVERLDLVVRMVDILCEEVLGILFEIENGLLDEVLFLVFLAQIVAV